MTRTILAALAALGLLAAPVRAEEIHLSHYGEVMPSIPWAVAFARGMFKANGVDVTGAISSQGGGTTIRNMLAGGVGFGESAGGATVAGINAGLPVKIVGVGSDSAADYAWVVPNASPLKTMKDAKGKKFGITTPGGVTYVYALLLLKQAGLTLDDVTAVPVGTGAGLAALDSGAIDTSYEYEPLYSRDEAKYRIIANVGDVMPRIVTLFLVATQDLIDKQPDKLRAILLTHKQAVDFIYSSPKQAADIAAKDMVGVDQAVVERSVARLAAVKYWSNGGFDKAALGNLNTVLNLTGEAKGNVDFAAMTDDRFLPAGAQRLK
jgi:NitT/TauT family transport system substrate-binding protein